MAVTSVQITSGPTVIGRSVTVSGTLSRNGTGTLNDVSFIFYDSTFVQSYSFPLLNAAGPEAVGVPWSLTRTLPNGNYLGITAYQSDAPYGALSSSSTAIGVVKVVSVSGVGRQPQGATAINWGSPLTRGLVLDWSAANPLINSVDGQRVIAPSPSPINVLEVGKARDFTNAVGGDTSWGGDYWPLNNENQWSVEAYIRITAATSYGNLLSKFAGGGQIYLRIDPSFAVGMGGNLNGNLAGSANSLSLNNWLYVVGTCDVSGLMKVYVDGRLTDTYQGTPITSYNNNKFYPDNTMDLQVGQNTGGIVTYAPKADIAFARLRKVALSPAEVRALAQNPWQVYRLSGVASHTRFISLPSTLTLYRSLILNNGRITQLPIGQENTGKVPLSLSAGLIKAVSSTTLAVGKFLPQRWRKQPSYPALIDESSRFAPEIVHAGTPYNAGENASKRYPVSFNGNEGSQSGPPVVGGRGGLAWKTIQYFEWHANRQPWKNDNLGDLNFPQTLMAVMSAECDTFSGTALYAGPSWGFGGGNRIIVNTSGQFAYIENYVELLTASVPIQTRKVNVLIATSTPGVGTKLFINGKIAASDAVYRYGSMGQYAPIARIGFTGDFGIYPWFTFLTAGWKRALADDEATALGENPWQMFKPAQQKFFCSLPSATPANALILKDNRIQTLNPTTDGLIT
jgi:hypothetical protein